MMSLADVGFVLLLSMYGWVWFAGLFRLCVRMFFLERDRYRNDKQTEQLSKVNYLRNNLNEETDYESS